MQLLKGLGAVLLLSQLSFAHFSIYGVWINGQWQGDGREVYVSDGISGEFKIIE